MIGITGSWLVVQLLAFISLIAKIKKTYLQNWVISTQNECKNHSLHFKCKICLKIICLTFFWRWTVSFKSCGWLGSAAFRGWLAVQSRACYNPQFSWYFPFSVFLPTSLHPIIVQLSSHVSILSWSIFPFQIYKPGVSWYLRVWLVPWTAKNMQWQMTVDENCKCLKTHVKINRYNLIYPIENTHNGKIATCHDAPWF